MATARTELLDRLRDAIRSWEQPPAHVSMFGSSARGDGDLDSDIDLFVVRPGDVDEEDLAWRRQLVELAEAVRRWTGNHASISEVSETETPRLAAEQPPVIADLKEDSVELAGKTVRQLLAGD